MPDLATLLPMIALLLGIGAFAGVIAGMLGVGGGIVLVPAFFYMFGHLGYAGPQLMQVCVATSLATIMATSMRSVMAHHRKGAVDWMILRQWAPWIVIGAIMGVFVAGVLKSTTLTAIFGILAMIAGLYMALGRDTWRVAQAMPNQPTRGILAVLIGFSPQRQSGGALGRHFGLSPIPGRMSQDAAGGASDFQVFEIPGQGIIVDQIGSEGGHVVRAAAHLRDELCPGQGTRQRWI